MTPTRSLALATLALAAGCSHAKPPATIAQRGLIGSPLVQATDPKLVDLMVEPTAPLVLASTVDDLGIHIRISGKALPTAHRPPLDLALVLDTSGSMEGTAITALKASADAVVEDMREGDRLSIITFDSKVAEPLTSSVITPAVRERAHAAIATIAARGTTDLQSGLSRAVAELAQRNHAHDLPRIVLVSDGVPNTKEQLPMLLAQIHGAGYSVTTLGLGNDYDTQVMTKIADDTGGTFHYIEKPEQIAAVFDDEITKMTTVVARNLRLTLSAGPGVALEPLAGFQGSAQTLTTLIGDLPADGVRDLVIPLKVSARGADSTAELADVSLDYADVIGGSGNHELTGFASAKASTDTAEIARNLRIDLEVARVRASVASAELEAMNLARGGQIGAAKARLAAAMTMLKAAQTHLKPGALDSVVAELTSLTKEVSSMVVQQAAVVSDKPGIAVPPARTVQAPAMAPAPADETHMRTVQDQASSTVRGVVRRR